MNILFTICARAGSKGLKNKNLKMLKGRPLVYYTLSAIKAYKVAHPDVLADVALNTDSEELIRQVNDRKLVENVIIVERKADLAGDTSAKVHVIQDTYRKCIQNGGKYDLVIDLDLTSPLRRLCDIENAVDQMKNDSSYDVVFSVVRSRRSPYFNMVELKKDGFYRKICDSDFTARQQAPVTYELNASIYVYRSSFLEGEIDKTLLEYNCGIVEMQDYLVLDIDSEEDFEMLEKLIGLYRSDERYAELVKTLSLNDRRNE